MVGRGRICTADAASFAPIPIRGQVGPGGQARHTEYFRKKHFYKSDEHEKERRRWLSRPESQTSTPPPPPIVILFVGPPSSFLVVGKVFQSMFEFLEENWSKLSPAVMKALKDRPLVPVGARLIKAGRLFFRLKVGMVSSLVSGAARVRAGLVCIRVLWTCFCSKCLHRVPKR